VIAFSASVVFSLTYSAFWKRFKVPLHSWKQEKSQGARSGEGGAKPLSCRFSWETAAHSMLCGREHCNAEATRLTATIRGVLLKFVDMSSTKLQSVLPTCRLVDDDQISHREFFNVFVRSACWKAPRSRLAFKWHVTTFEPRKRFVNPCLAQSFFKSLSKHCDSLCCCFPQKETKLDANTF